jgi:N-methylhydantoinase A
MPAVVIPRETGVFCAMGMLFSDLKIDLVQSYVTTLDRLDRVRWQSIFVDLEQRGRDALTQQGIQPDAVDVVCAADLRYLRQLHELTVALDPGTVADPDPARLHALFDTEHERLFGYHLLDHGLDLTVLRVTCIGRLARPNLTLLKRGTGSQPLLPRTLRAAYVPGQHTFADLPVFDGETLSTGNTIVGPALMELPQTTVVVPDGFALSCPPSGLFVLRRAASIPLTA